MADLRSGGGGRRITAIRQALRTVDRRSPRPLAHLPAPSRAPGPRAALPRTRLAAVAAPETLEGRTLLSTYYVATNGSDSADGSLGSPLRTIQQAANRADAGDTVVVRAGTYRETVTPAHSGSSSRPITFKPYDGERVTISGADRVSGWSLNGGSVYKADQSW